MKSLVFQASGIRQIFAMVAIFAMVVFSVQGIFVSVAHAEGTASDLEVTGINGQCVTVGTEITLTGVVTAFDGPGHYHQYGYRVEWGDGDYTDSGNDVFDAYPEGTPLNIEHTHTYTTLDTNVSITVTVYHQSFTGQDGNSVTTRVFDVCTPNPASITVVKEVTSGDASTVFDFTASFGGFTLSADSDPHTSGDLVAADGPYSVSEDVLAGWVLDSAICSDGSDPSSIALDPGEQVTCTFVNSPVLDICEDPGALNNGQEAPCEYPQVTLCKKDPTGAPLGGWDLSLDLDGQGDPDYVGTTVLEADPAGCVLIGDVPLGDYILDEDLAAHAGWVNVDSEYDKGETVTVDSATHTFTLVNEELPPNVGTIIVEKEVLNTTVPYDSFWFSVNDGDPIQFEADGTNEFQYEAGTVVSVVETTTGDFATAYTNCMEVEIVEGQAQTCTITNRYPIVPTYYVDGYKWNDEDGDGLWDEGENTISDWDIEITNGEVTYATSTDSEGYYWFEVPAGTWTVSEVQQSGWEQTAPEEDICQYIFGGQTFDIAYAVLADDVALNRCNFGNTEIPEPLACSLSASSNPVSKGAGFDLTWAGSPELTYMEIDNGIGEVSAPTGLHQTSITEQTKFTMTAYEWVEYGEGDEIVDHSDPVYCDVTVDVRSSSGGGGGGSTRPVCEAFSMDDDTLSWETRRGDDLVIAVNGAEIYSLNDDEDGQDALDEGSLTTVAMAGGEYVLTVSRGSREDTCSFTLPRPEVAGEQISVVPLGAADTGAGGRAGSALPMTFAVLGMLASLAAIRVTRNG